MNSCKRNLKTEEKLLFISKDLNSNRKRLMICKSNMMKSQSSMMRDMLSKNKNINKIFRKQ